MKRKVVWSIILSIVSISCVLFATIMQMKLAYEKYGAIFEVFIPHWSAWFYLGGIGLFVGGKSVWEEL